MTTQTNTNVHKAVQEHYGKLAKESGACCEIAPGAAPSDNLLYPQELLAGLPPDISGFTAGSGDPISLAKLRPGEIVLDLGSGGGLDCFLAAQQVGKSGKVIGVDMTPEMLARARAAAERLGMQNVEFRAGYLESLPVEDSSIDVIISNCVINLSPDKLQVFNEMQRVLKAGGRVAVSDIVTNRPLSKEALKGDEDWCGCVTGSLAYQDYIDALGKAGFVDVHLEPNLELIEKGLESGQINIESKRKLSKEEILDEIRNWETLEGNIFAPFKITARKAG